MRRSLRLLLALLVVLALLAAACGDDDSSSDGDDGTTTAEDGAPADLEGEVLVSAAASLTDAFTEIGDAFEEANPGTTVTFTFDSSGTLSDQILEGAPVDVFASADESNMEKLTAEDLIAGNPAVFARNQLVIVTKPGNPEGIEGLADLADAGTIALCSEDAPCGRFAGEVLDGAGVEIPESSVTRGQNVRATLDQVVEGDAVAGIVYVTDAAAAGDDVTTVAIPEDQNAIAVYPIGVLAAAGNAEVAEAFLAHVTSDDGQLVLKEHGFLEPA